MVVSLPPALRVQESWLRWAGGTGEPELLGLRGKGSHIPSEDGGSSLPAGSVPFVSRQPEIPS